MDDGKKYYYLKLKDNFFHSDEIRLIRSLENGPIIIIIYQKLLLIGDYCTHGFRFIKHKFKDFGATEYLAIITDEPSLIVHDAVAIFQKYNLLEIVSGGYLLKDINIDLESRNTKEYYSWKEAVFKRDNYMCQKCSTTLNLHGHHLKPWSTNKRLRYDIDNGLTLCKECHLKVHKKIGRL